MRAILLLAIWFLAINAFAAEQSMTAVDIENNSVTVYRESCVDVKHKYLKGQADKFQRAELIFHGKGIKACWALADDGYVYVVDERGKVYTVPAGAFQPDPPVSRM